MATTKWPLKTWHSSDWSQPLSKSTTVCMTDEDVPVNIEERVGYIKPRFFYLAQTGSTPPVRTHLRGTHRHLLLTEAEARKLLDYLTETFEVFDIDDATATRTRRKQAKRTPPKRNKRG